MLFFVNDYCEGAHESILSRLTRENTCKRPGYGSDEVCASAKEKIRQACESPDAQIYFAVGGTQTNQLVLDTMLQPYEGVVAVQTGHIALHEAGAIEYTGHKVLTLPAHEGKMISSELESLVRDFYEDENHEHMVFPGMVYLSHPTEYGTLYTKEELSSIREVCDRYGLRLFVDGARLAYGLGAEGTDLFLPDLARLCDAFSIGGTKCGALFGEAVVFGRGPAPSRFLTRIKQHGALLAKGWLLGVQFDELFSDDLYVRLGLHADRLADKLRACLVEKGYRLLLTSPTNQVLVVLQNPQMEQLASKVRFSFWEKTGPDETAIRFCTSWATTEEDLDRLLEIL